MNPADLLSRQAAAQPFPAAVIRGRQTITFSPLELLVWRLAAWIRGGGRPGQPRAAPSADP